MKRLPFATANRVMVSLGSSLDGAVDFFASVTASDTAKLQNRSISAIKFKYIPASSRSRSSSLFNGLLVKKYVEVNQEVDEPIKN